MLTLTRRRALQIAGGVVLSVWTPSMKLGATEGAMQLGALEAAWRKSPGRAPFRIEGMTKVTGGKIYARDLRARDFSAWPQDGGDEHVLILRATYADRTFESIELPSDVTPSRILTGATLRSAGLVIPREISYDLDVDERELALRAEGTNVLDGFLYDLIIQSGSTPEYLGQPVAFLYFDSWRSHRLAAAKLKFRDDVVVYGGPSSPTPDSEYGTPRVYVKDEARFSYVHDYDEDYEVNAEDLSTGFFSQSSTQEVIRSNGWLVHDATFRTQAMDPFFMEPEAGLAWYDRAEKTLHLVLGTQSPDHDVQNVATLFSGPKSPMELDKVELVSCYPGGGFGGRDQSVFTMYLAIAAAFAEGRPVRLAYDRFEQFQVGLKRHASKIDQRMVFDKSGRIQMLLSRLNFDGGGRINLSPAVASLAALSSASAYDVPRASVKSVSRHSPNTAGGSQRGFGGPQAFLATECMIDEAASRHGWDPIEIRRANLLKASSTTLAGAPVETDLRLDEICARAKSHPLWKKRESVRRNRANSGRLYGVGFALSMEAYGTSGDGLFGCVELDRQGEITVRTNAVDMGNGSATTLAIAPAEYCGMNASQIAMGEVAVFDALGLRSDFGSAELNRWSNPRWVPKVSASSSACLTAFYQVHAIKQAARALLETGLLRAAERLWGVKDLTADDVAFDRTGAMVKRAASRRNPLTLPELAQVLFQDGGVVGTIVHSYYQGEWAAASFEVAGKDFHWPIDTLAVIEAGRSSPRVIDRRDLVPPPAIAKKYGRSRYAPSGSLAAVEIDPNTGRAGVVAVTTIIDAGAVIVRDLVEGQNDGGVSMAIGYALLENAPPGREGPAGGRWNVNRYRVPVAADIPLTRTELVLLDPLSNDATAKGIGEAVMCAVPPAIVNAVAHATGKRFYTLPLTPDVIREAL
jgi:CO/xanthine dehydrogenase Mo-binding subunit